MPVRILLVDDSPTILSLLSLILKEQGWVVHCAKDGVDALERLAETSVDMVITDVNMPRMDGLTLISRIRALPQWVKLPIVVLSTESDPRDQQRGLDRGANLYLVKPVKPAALVSQVRALLP